MKKLFFALLVLLLIPAGYAQAADWSGIGTHERSIMIVQKQVTLSADAADQTLPAVFRGCYIYQLEVSASLDDAVTFTVHSALGNPLVTITTTAATSADASNIVQPTGYYWIGEQEVATWTLANLGSGTVTIQLTGAKK